MISSDRDVIHAASEIDSHVDVMNDEVLKSNEGDGTGHINPVPTIANDLQSFDGQVPCGAFDVYGVLQTCRSWASNYRARLSVGFPDNDRR